MNVNICHCRGRSKPELPKCQGGLHIFINLAELLLGPGWAGSSSRPDGALITIISQLGQLRSTGGSVLGR